MNRNKVIKKNENDMIKIFEEEIALKDNLIKAQQELMDRLLNEAGLDELDCEESE